MTRKSDGMEYALKQVGNNSHLKSTRRNQHQSNAMKPDLILFVIMKFKVKSETFITSVVPARVRYHARVRS